MRDLELPSWLALVAEQRYHDDKSEDPGHTCGICAETVNRRNQERTAALEKKYGGQQ